ncbi:MAG: DUF3987 domain-containing protein [Deltaproteobacteria bacterium]|jgi:cytochrome c556|nr:DUF3987 domain-containing protein [Deltaproteobacteria bacterium]
MIAGDHAESTVAAVRCVPATRVLPSLGDRKADGIRQMDVMAALAPLVAEGKLSTWRKARGIIGRVIRHGMARDHELMVPTSGLQGAVAAPRTVPRAVALLSGTTRLPRVAVLATILGGAGACRHAKTVGASIEIDGHVKERETPCGMYHLIIAGSGGGKSSLFNAVFGPIWQISGKIRDEERKWEEEVKAHNVLLDEEIASAKKSFNERAERDAEARRKTQESIAELEAAKETFYSGVDKILADTTVEALPVGIAGDRETGPK